MHFYLSAALLLVLALAADSASAARVEYVAPSAKEGLSVNNQVYLIGVVSTVVVIIAVIMAVIALTSINYDDDTILMVEVPDDEHHDE